MSDRRPPRKGYRVFEIQFDPRRQAVVDIVRQTLAALEGIAPTVKVIFETNHASERFARAAVKKSLFKQRPLKEA